LEKIVPGDPRRRTFVELIAETMIREAIKGNVLMAKEIFDRVEGKVPQRRVEPNDEPTKITIVSHVPRPDRSAMQAPVPGPQADLSPKPTGYASGPGAANPYESMDCK